MKSVKIIISVIVFILLNIQSNASDIVWANYGVKSYINMAVMSADGNYLAGVLISDKQMVFVLDMTTRAIVWADSGYIVDCSLSPDGKYLAYSKYHSYNPSFWQYSAGEIYIVDWAKNKILVKDTLISPKENITQLKFSPYTNICAFTSYEFDIFNPVTVNRLYFYDLDKNFTRSVKETDPIYAMQFTTDASQLYIYALNTKDSLQLPYYIGNININTFELIYKSGYFQKWAFYFEVNRLGTEYILPEMLDEYHKKIVSRDFMTNTVQKEIYLDARYFQNFHLSNDYKKIAVPYENGGNFIEIFDANSFKSITKLEVPHYPYTMNFIGNTGNIIFADADRIKIWNVSTGKVEEVYRFYKGYNHNAIPYNAAISSDGRILATNQYDDEIKLWDMGTGKYLGTIVDTNSNIRHLSFGESNDTLITLTSTIYPNLKTWDINKKNELMNYQYHGIALLSDYIDRTGTNAIISSMDTMTYIIDTKSGKLYDSLVTGLRNYIQTYSAYSGRLVMRDSVLRIFKPVNKVYTLEKDFGISTHGYYGADITPDDSMFAYSTGNEAIVLRTDNWKQMYRIDYYYMYKSSQMSSNIDILKFTNDKQFLLAAEANVLKVCNNAGCLKVFDEAASDPYKQIENVIISNDNRILITTHQDGSIIRWKTQGVTGVPEINSNTPFFSAYPNPANNYFDVKLDNSDYYTFKMTDIIGKEMDLNFISKNERGARIDLNRYPAGVYFLEIRTSNKSKTMKIIKL